MSCDESRIEIWGVAFERDVLCNKSYLVYLEVMYIFSLLYFIKNKIIYKYCTVKPRSLVKRLYTCLDFDLA